MHTALLEPVEGIRRPRSLHRPRRSLKQCLALIRGPHRSLPAPHVPARLESALPQSHSTIRVSPGHPLSSLLPSPTATPHPPAPQEGFLPKEWKREAFAQEWPGCFLPGLAVLWQQAMGLRSTSRHLQATLSEDKNVFHVVPTRPCLTVH